MSKVSYIMFSGLAIFINGGCIVYNTIQSVKDFYAIKANVFRFESSTITAITYEGKYFDINEKWKAITGNGSKEECLQALELTSKTDLEFRKECLKFK